MNRIATMVAAALAACATGLAADAAPAGPIRNIVLVHGAFADGSGWRMVSDILTRDGYHVSIVQPPETSLDDDIAATRRVLDAQNGPAVLVDHSYGGMIITGAGSDPQVRSLVYIAAFAPDTGESLASLEAGKPAAATSVKPTPDGGCRAAERGCPSWTHNTADPPGRED